MKVLRQLNTQGYLLPNRRDSTGAHSPERFPKDVVTGRSTGADDRPGVQPLVPLTARLQYKKCVLLPCDRGISVGYRRAFSITPSIG